MCVCGSRARGRVGARGGARGRGLSSGQGTFSANRPPARASGGLARTPRRGRESAKLLSGHGTDLVPRGFCGFLALPRPALSQPGPLPRIQTSRLDPVHAAPRGPRAALAGSATFSSVPESRRRAPLGRGTTSPCGRPPQPGGRGVMGGSLAGPGAGGQVLGEGRAASQTLPSCHRPLAVVGRSPAPRPLPLRRADAGVPPRRPLPRVAVVCPAI